MTEYVSDLLDILRIVERQNRCLAELKEQVDKLSKELADQRQKIHMLIDVSNDHNHPTMKKSANFCD